MAFLPNIPLSTDQLSVSQGDILNNFGILGAIAGNAFDSSSSINVNSGFNWVYLPNNAATPPSGSFFTAGEIAIYGSANSVTSQNELYINKRNQATTVQIPATASILSVTSAPAALSAGWTYLPSGIILKWGASIAANGQTTITFPAAANIKAFTTCITVIVQINSATAGDVDQAIRLMSVAATTFDVYGSARSTTGAAAVTFSYLAIGY